MPLISAAQNLSCLHFFRSVHVSYTKLIVVIQAFRRCEGFQIYLFLCKVIDTAVSGSHDRCMAATIRNSLRLQFCDSFLHSYIKQSAKNQAFWCCKKNWARWLLLKVCFARSPRRLDPGLENAARAGSSRDASYAFFKWNEKLLYGAAQR